ncbi:MAG: DUF1592 domain-containing protein [Myxococcota bacterium]
MMMWRGFVLASSLVAMACDGSLSGQLSATSESTGDSSTPNDEPGSQQPGERRQLSAADLFPCSDSLPSGPGKSLMLSRGQLQNTLEDLFGSAVLGSASVALSRLPDEVFDDVSHIRLSTVSSAKIDAFYQIARSVSDGVISDDDATRDVFGGCALSGSQPAACVSGFVDGFAARILRRPLEERERAFIQTLIDQPDSELRAQLGAALTYLLASPHFLWRIERGVEAAEDRTTTLSQYEIATRISYIFADTTPDTALESRAREGRLNSIDAVRDEARRMLRTPRGRRKLTQAIARWSLTDRTEDLSNLPAGLTEGVDVPALEASMVEEAQYYIETMVFERNTTFEELLTSSLSFAEDPELASLYGHTPAGPDSPSEFSGRRRGLLLRAPALTATGARAHIINRGVDTQLRFLCNKIPEPNVDIADDRTDNEPSEEEQLAMSNRAIVEQATSNELCASCHDVINPTGAVFESFDSLGRLREQEQIFDSEGESHGFVDIDSAAEIPLASGETISAADAYDFVGYIAESNEGKACFTRNVFRYMGEKAEENADECGFLDEGDALLASTTSIVELVVASIANPDFLIKRND